jgi:1-acyl-sn-glycerol-3-phosphate acyltransferase
MYRLAQILLWPFFHLFFLLRQTGKEHLPREGKVIVICNHISVLDPITLGVTLPRPIHFMAKIELFKNPLIAKLLKSLNAFPVDRSRGDVASIKKAISILSEEKVFGIFPEGTRGAGTMKEGAAMIALKSGAPVVPVYIEGRYKLFRPMKVWVGEAIQPPRLEGRLKQQVDAFAPVIAHAVEKLEKNSG